MKNDITPHNDKGQAHGYWERYYSNGNICYKGNYLNGDKIGYWEYYILNGELMAKEYFIL